MFHQYCLHVRRCCPSPARVEHEPDRRGVGGTSGQKRAEKRPLRLKKPTVTRFLVNYHTFPLYGHTIHFRYRVTVWLRVPVCTHSPRFP